MEFKARFPRFFTFFRGVYFLMTGNTKTSDLKGDQSFLSFVNVNVSLIFSLLECFRDRRWKALLEQSNLDFFKVCRYNLSAFITQ